MESDQEVHSAFSRLNVNAIEFVPSFGFAAPPAIEPDTTIEETLNAQVETPENNGNGEWRAIRNLVH